MKRITEINLNFLNLTKNVFILEEKEKLSERKFPLLQDSGAMLLCLRHEIFTKWYAFSSGINKSVGNTEKIEKTGGIRKGRPHRKNGILGKETNLLKKDVGEIRGRKHWPNNVGIF